MLNASVRGNSLLQCVINLAQLEASFSVEFEFGDRACRKICCILLVPSPGCTKACNSSLPEEGQVVKYSLLEGLSIILDL